MLSTNKGFTLIELMIVVVIIGILASIAIPSYQGFQDKAKSAEAKIQLSEIYIAEKNFYSEWNTYSTDLSIIGLVASPLHYYAVGFVGRFPGTAGGGTSNNTVMKKSTVGAFSNSVVDLVLKNIHASARNVANRNKCFQSKFGARPRSFHVCAGGSDDNDWSMDSNRVVSRLQ